MMHSSYCRENGCVLVILGHATSQSTVVLHPLFADHMHPPPPSPPTLVTCLGLTACAATAACVGIPLIVRVVLGTKLTMTLVVCGVGEAYKL